MNIRKLVMLSALALASAGMSAATDDPVAAPGAVVSIGNARFTVLTSRLVRMEWAADGKHEDQATLGIVNRRLPVPRYKVSRKGNTLTITTDHLTLRYKNTGRFCDDNLSVSFANPATGSAKSKRVVWVPSLKPTANLLGTERTIDAWDHDIFAREAFDNGVLSRDGWAMVDESKRHLLTPVKSDWQHWAASRTDVDRQDLYMFAYGHNYKEALADFAKVSGRIPMPPKYAFGYWWCRYWMYSDCEFTDLASHLRSFDIPMDVMVIDMDWHEDWAETDYEDQSGEDRGWTGYTWRKVLFPNPANFLGDLHNFGVKTALNLHFNSGIQPYEEPYKRFVADYLGRTSDYDGPKNFVKEDGTAAGVPFRIDQMEWADAYFNSVIRPFERQGVDFWWLDWQQWRESRYTKGLSNTFWLNYAFYNDMRRQSAKDGMYARRPMIYHRWGGIGSHRYPVGFSGDCYSDWKTLAFLPYFTATASNVGYGYWGHDIGGHMPVEGATSTDGELYTRWLQNSVFYPIYKTHSTKDVSTEKRFWMFPQYFDAMRSAIRLRYTLSPYIYTAAREGYDTGVCMCRPMYYDYPDNNLAYDYKEQFMLGNHILAAGVCERVDSVTGLAPRKVWLPAGNAWYDAATGATYDGGQELDLLYTIDENPYFVKAGAILPMASPEIKSLQQQSNETWYFVAPGDGTSTATLYEDDGSTQAYESEYATTAVTKTSDAAALKFTVAPRQGHYRDMCATRRVRIKLEGVFAPAAVTVDGVRVSYSRYAATEAANSQQPVWGYDGATLAATVYLPEQSCDKAVTVECAFDPVQQASRQLISGKKGLMRRFMALTPEAKLVYSTYVHRQGNVPTHFLALGQCASFITESPADAPKLLNDIDLNAVATSFDKYEDIPDAFKAKFRAQLHEVKQ